MNATPTTLRDVLWRWQRGIARALLVMMGALAGMTLGTVAHAQIAFRAAQSAAQSAPLPPAFQAAGTAVANAAAITVAWPAHEVGDIGLLIIETANQAVILGANAADWTAVTNSPQGTPGTLAPGTATRLTVFWSRATSGAMGSVGINDSGNHQIAQIITFRGVFASGNPWDGTPAGDVAATAATAVSIPGGTTTVANTLVVAIVANGTDTATAQTSGWTNASLSSLTERVDFNDSSAANGGGFGVATGVMAAFGAYGATTATLATSFVQGRMSIALRPVTSALTITKPAGTVANDVMVASIGYRLNSPGIDPRDIGITAPAGWALVPTGRIDNLNSTGSGLAVYTKVAAGEPANYTWTFSCINVSGSNTCVTLGFSAAAGGIVSFSGVETTAPIDVENGAPTTVATATPATPDVTTTVANAMLVTSHAIANGNAWAPPSGRTEAFQVTSAPEMVQVSYVLQAVPGATGPITATDAGTPDAADFGNAHILALRPALPVFNQSAYRLFDNANSTDVGTALAAQDTAATLGQSFAAFRLRVLLHVSNANLAISGQAFKLQFAARSGTCDTAFSGEAYADVTATTVIAYFNNATPADGANLTANASDPTHGADTVVNQTYEELNNFTNSTAAINSGQDGKWDFALKDNGAPENTPYCFRVVTDTGAVLGAYTVIPEITTAPRGTVFYFHDAATPNTGTLPGATTLSATTPNVTAAGAGTNRDMDQTIGTAQVSAALTTNASTSLRKNWFRRFLSRPLAAQTLPTGNWKIQGGASESNAASNMLLWGAVITVWRPSTGATVATLLDDPVLGTVEPGTSQTDVTKLTATVAGVAVNDGDILVVELWAENTQGSATAYTNTIFYDGTTENPMTSNAASFLQAPSAITFYRSLRQSAYRLFDNADSTDVGTALAAQDTAATLGATGAAFRLRMLLHVADINLGLSGQAFKLQFAARSGTCDTAFSGEAYADVTAASVIAYNNNATPADGANLTANASDPTHGADTVVNQTYEELNNFTNSTAAINSGQDGKWDFALKDNGAPASTAYCFRVVKSTGTVLDTYIVIPEITTASAVPTPGSFNAFETSTAAGAITGRIYTKLVGTIFSLDVVAIASGAQQAGFTDAVIVELLGNNTLGVSLDAQNCPTSSTLVQTVAPNPTITGGRSTVNFAAVANSWRDVRVRVKWPTSSPTVTWCSTDNFAIRPTNLTVTSTNATNNATSGAPTFKTGANFNLTAATVSGYGGTPTIDNTKVVGSPNAGTIGGTFAAAVAGTATGNSFFYSEVGNFGLNANAVYDSSFTSVDQPGGDCTADFSNSLVGGKYGCSFGSTAVAQTTGVSGFGRFIPDNFNVTYNTPSLTTSCAGGTFTYVGQAIPYTTAPQMTVIARSGTLNGLTNTTTTNYAGAYMKLSNAAATSLNQAPYNTQPGRYARFDALGGGATPALDTSALPATTADPTIGVFTNGVGALTFSSGTGLGFVRSTTTPNAPFNADIALALNVIDTDGVVFASNPASFGAASAGNGIAFSSGKAMRFGRLAVRNANGSQLVPLPVQIEAQYWSGAPTNAFITNTQDSCTAIATNNAAMSNFTNNLSACETANTAVSAFSSGRGTLTLAAPGSGNNGSVDLTVNLSSSTSGTTCTTVGGGTVPAAGANRAYLQGNWTGGAYNVNPSARATFGVFKGAEEVIFQRENF